MVLVIASQGCGEYIPPAEQEQAVRAIVVVRRYVLTLGYGRYDNGSVRRGVCPVHRGAEPTCARSERDQT